MKKKKIQFRNDKKDIFQILMEHVRRGKEVISGKNLGISISW